MYAARSSLLMLSRTQQQPMASNARFLLFTSYPYRQ